MIGLEVLLLPEELQKKDIENSLVVVIDVLRASSTITTALAEGASKIIPIYLPEDAQKKAKKFDSGSVLLCGERGGKKLSGFDLGNSPLEYKRKKINNKVLLLTTTNGTRTIELACKANKIIIGCFLNIKAIAKYCLSYFGKVFLACAGDRGAVSLEDTVCAGMIMTLSMNQSQKYDFRFDDSMIAFQLYQEYGHNLLAMMKTSNWGKHLINMGLQQDIDYCAQKNIYHHIPVIQGNEIRNSFE